MLPPCSILMSKQQPRDSFRRVFIGPRRSFGGTRREREKLDRCSKLGALPSVFHPSPLLQDPRAFIPVSTGGPVHPPSPKIQSFIPSCGRSLLDHRRDYSHKYSTRGQGSYIALQDALSCLFLYLSYGSSLFFNPLPLPHMHLNVCIPEHRACCSEVNPYLSSWRVQKARTHTECLGESVS